MTPRKPPREDLTPPWVLFMLEGKPYSILPAGRQGVVADVQHLKLADARLIVRLANELRDAAMRARIAHLEKVLGDLAKLFKAPVAPKKGARAGRRKP